MPEKTKAKAAPASAPMQELQDAGLGSLTWMGTAWAEAMSDIGSELMSFLAERIQEDVKTQHKILHCKSLTELQEVQTAFLDTAMLPANQAKAKATPI